MKYTEQDVAELVEAIRNDLKQHTRDTESQLREVLDKFVKKPEWMMCPSTANVWYLKPQGRLMDIGYVTISSSQYVCFRGLVTDVQTTDADARRWCENQLEQ